MSTRSKKNIKTLTLKFFRVEKTQGNKKVQITLKEGDTLSTWFPLSKVSVNHKNKTVMGPEWIMKIKLKESKTREDVAKEDVAKYAVEAVEAVKKKMDLRKKNNEMVELEKAYCEDEKSIGIECSYWCSYNKDIKWILIFFLKSEIKNGCAPQWLINEKMEEQGPLVGLRTPAKGIF